MYRCAVSGKVSQPGEPAYKVVTKTRNKVYFQNQLDKNGKPVLDAEGKNVKYRAGEGREIVQEIVVCKEVFEKMTGGNNGSKSA